MDRLASVSAARGGTPQEQSAKALEELAKFSSESLRDAGLGALLKAWNLENPGAFAGGDTAEGLALFFTGRGLSCETLRPGTVQLVAMNLPALVRVKVKDQSCWVGMIRADEDRVVLALEDGREVSLGRTAFRDIYQNEALIPWRDSAPAAPLLLPGQKGAPVTALKQQLRALGLINEKNTLDTYDSETASAVTAIQAETGLKMDGKAGRQVRMVLAAWSGAEDSPSLRPRSSSAAPVPPSSSPAATTAPANLKDPVADQAPAPPVAPPAPPQAAPEPAAPAAAVEKPAEVAAPVPAPDQAAETDKPAEPTPPAPEATAPEATAAPAPPEPAKEPEKREQSAAIMPAGEFRAESGAPLEVRELPAPTAMEPLPPAENERTGDSTEPVAGSSPLVPRNGSPA